MWWLLPILLGGGVIWAVTAKKQAPIPAPTVPPQAADIQAKAMAKAIADANTATANANAATKKIQEETTKKIEQKKKAATEKPEGKPVIPAIPSPVVPDATKVDINYLPLMVKQVQSKISELEGFITTPAFSSLPSFVQSKTQSTISLLKSELAKAETKLRQIQTPPPIPETPTEKIEQKPVIEENKVEEEPAKQESPAPSIFDIFKSSPKEDEPSPTQEPSPTNEERVYEEPKKDDKETILPSDGVHFEFNLNKAPLKSAVKDRFGNTWQTVKIINPKLSAKIKLITTLTPAIQQFDDWIPKSDIPEKFEVEVLMAGSIYSFTFPSSSFVDADINAVAGIGSVGRLRITPPQLTKSRKITKQVQIARQAAMAKLSKALAKIPTSPRIITRSSVIL